MQWRTGATYAVAYRTTEDGDQLRDRTPGYERVREGGRPRVFGDEGGREGGRGWEEKVERGGGEMGR